MTLSRKARRTSKYGNKKVELDGYTFDSTAEATFYQGEVLTNLQAGAIADWELHPKCPILPTHKKFGRTIRAASYSPDFHIVYVDGRDEWIEVKGARAVISEASGLRMKVFDFIYPGRRLRLWTPKSGYLS